jgi:hypothetical protein
VRKRKAKRGAVLGCGPAGLFAAHAFVEHGWDVTIFSRKRRSEMFGAQHLHRGPIPGLKGHGEPPMKVDVQLLGTWEGCTRKTYGVNVKPITPWEDYRRERQMAWDVRAAYYDAWSRYGELIEDTEIQDLGAWATWHEKDFNSIVSSLPLRRFCDKEWHRFPEQEIWTVGDAPERGVFCPIPCPPFTVINNGIPDVGWNKVSNLFGYTTAQWALDRRPPIENLVPIGNPLSTTCSCFPNVVRVGRFGTWTRGVLAEDAYWTVSREIEK